jgi:ketosteroid isomerase-like protein
MSAENNAELIKNTWKDVVAGNVDAAAANMSDEVSWMIAGNLPGVSGVKKGQSGGQGVHRRNPQGLPRGAHQHHQQSSWRWRHGGR